MSFHILVFFITQSLLQHKICLSFPLASLAHLWGEPLLSSASHLRCSFAFISFREFTNCGGRFILIFFHYYRNMLRPLILCHRTNWKLKFSVTRDESSEYVRQQCWTMALWRCSAVFVAVSQHFVVVCASSSTECYTFHSFERIFFVSVSLQWFDLTINYVNRRLSS